jgi:hypothetical protein
LAAPKQVRHCGGRSDHRVETLVHRCHGVKLYLKKQIAATHIVLDDNNQNIRYVAVLTALCVAPQVVGTLEIREDFKLTVRTPGEKALSIIK